MANKGAFGLRWLLEKCNVYPNAFYNFLKQRKAKHRLEKSHILAQIEEIYHSHNGVDRYRKMKIYLQRRLINLSLPTVQKYMNGDLHLRAVVRRKKPAYQEILRSRAKIKNGLPTLLIFIWLTALCTITAR